MGVRIHSRPPGDGARKSRCPQNYHIFRPCPHLIIGPVEVPPPRMGRPLLIESRRMPLRKLTEPPPDLHPNEPQTPAPSNELRPLAQSGTTLPGRRHPIRAVRRSVAWLAQRLLP